MPWSTPPFFAKITPSLSCLSFFSFLIVKVKKFWKKAWHYFFLWYNRARFFNYTILEWVSEILGSWLNNLDYILITGMRGAFIFGDFWVLTIPTFHFVNTDYSIVTIPLFQLNNTSFSSQHYQPFMAITRVCVDCEWFHGCF